MPTGDPVPNVIPPRTPRENPRSDPPSSPSAAASEPRAALSPKGAAIAAKTNYVSPYRQAAQNRTTPGSAGRANNKAGTNTHSPNFKDIVNRFNTKQDEKIPNPTNRIPATTAGSSAAKTRRAIPKTPTSSRPSSAAAKRHPLDRSTSAQSTYSSSSAAATPGSARRGSVGVGSNDSEKASNPRAGLPPIQTSFGGKLEPPDRRQGRRRAASVSESRSPSTASLADNEEGTSLSDRKTIHHRRSRSNIELSSLPIPPIITDPARMRDAAKNAKNGPKSSPRSPRSPRSPASARSGIPVLPRSNLAQTMTAEPSQPGAGTSQAKKSALKPVPTSAHSSRHVAQPAKSTMLDALISSPPPKKSPPLRSTKGQQRLPAAATATTASSRQRLQHTQPPPSLAKENRIPGSKTQGRGRSAVLEERKSKNPKRPIPELGTIDFAARRARIQSAFTKSFKEDQERPQIIRRTSSKNSLNGDSEGLANGRRVSTPVLAQRIDEEDEEEDTNPQDVQIIQVVPGPEDRMAAAMQDISEHDIFEGKSKHSDDGEVTEAPATGNGEPSTPVGDQQSNGQPNVADGHAEADESMPEPIPEEAEVTQPAAAESEAKAAVPEPSCDASPRIMPRSRASSVLSRSRSSSVGRRNRVSAVFSPSGLDAQIFIADNHEDQDGATEAPQREQPEVQPQEAPPSIIPEEPASVSGHPAAEALSEPVPVVVTPESPQQHSMFSHVSEMLRSTSTEWSTESEFSGNSPDVPMPADRHSMSGLAVVVDAPEHDEGEEPGSARISGHYKWTPAISSGYETVSPMLSTATSDDRATIASLFDRYDEPREDFLKSYENSPVISRDSHIDHQVLSGVEEEESRVEGWTGYELSEATAQAADDGDDVTELEDDGQHCPDGEDNVECTSCSEVESSARQSGDSASSSDGDWTSSGEQCLDLSRDMPRPISRPDSPTTPRQPLEAEASPLPPTPPPKDMPTPPPKDIASPPSAQPPPPPLKQFETPSPVPSALSQHSYADPQISAYGSMFLPEIETDSEPLGLAIQSLPSQYEFRPGSLERQTTYPQPNPASSVQLIQSQPRASLDRHPYGSWQSLPSEPHPSQAQPRPSLEATPSYLSKYSPSSSYTDVESRRSSGPFGHRLSETPASSMVAVPIGRGSPPLQAEDPAALNRQLTQQQKNMRKRLHLMKEIVDTESAFFRDMTVAEEIYKGSANACSSITQDDIKVLFGNTNDIVHFSKAFLETVKAAVAPVYVMRRGNSGLNSSAASVANSTNSDDRGGYMEETLTDEEKDRKTYIGEAFAENLYRMEKVYGDYCKNHDASVARLQKLEESKGVSIWLQECKACAEDLTNAWNLESLLIKPVQRVLKYPLLLTQLLEVTPRSHPDYAALEASTKEMKFAADRINEMKKRKDIVEKIVGRKRNDSDIRHGISKGFARQAEKLRQSVGLSGVVVDDTYNRLFENYNMHFVQVQVISRDIEVYVEEIQLHVEKLADFTQSFREFAEVTATQHPEVELKWRKLDAAMKEVVATYLQEHRHRVRKHCIEPLEILLKMHESPQRVMTKRNKKAVDYARFKAIKDRGDKADKKTIELAEAYVALNETLIDELPRLFTMTKKLVDTVLANFIELQAQWMSSWGAKMKMAFVELDMPEQLSEVVKIFTDDFSYNEQLLQQLSICNGSLVAMQLPSVNFLSPGATTLSLDAFESSSLRPRTATADGRVEMTPTPEGRERSSSLTAKSPTTTATTFDAILDKNNLNDSRRGSGGSASSLPVDPARRPVAAVVSTSRMPTRSPSAPSHPKRTVNIVPTDRHASASYESRGSYSLELPPAVLPSTSFFDRPEISRFATNQTMPEYTHHDINAPGEMQDASPVLQQQESLFSSAMPMDDDHDLNLHSRTNSPAPSDMQNSVVSRTSSRAERRRTLTLSSNDKAMFVAASLYEFNISRERREAGFPYLTYVQGEIFDVIGIKGEIWLARNQDDEKGEIGWIWCKHFARLPDDYNQE